MKSAPSERELQIGRRLRAFREDRRIPRTAFALSIGIGSERLASYESGRVPLRYEMFLAIHQKYFINPVWLATGREWPAFESPIDFGRIGTGVFPKWPFTEMYDRALDGFCRQRALTAEAIAGRIAELISRLLDFIDTEGGSVRATADIAFQVRQKLGMLDSVLEKISHLGLTAKSKYRKYTPVPLPTLKELLDQTRELVRASGMKAVLATYLGVPQSRVSEWLGGKHEPSGEVALKLLKWVSEPDRKQNALGSATNTAKGKVTRGQKSYETKPSSSRKTK